MAKKRKNYKKLSDNNIVALVDDQVSLSIGYSDSELSTERAKIIDTTTVLFLNLLMMETQSTYH